MLGPMKKIKKEHWELNKQQIRLKKNKNWSFKSSHFANTGNAVRTHAQSCVRAKKASA